MRIDIITLFPRMFEGILGESILKRAQQKKLVTFSMINLRDFSTDKHRKVDDRPFGGGPGMVICAEPVWRALESIGKRKGKKRVVLLTPRGKKFDQAAAKRLARERHLILLCGHYEGFDERIKKWVDEEVSIGDYVLTGGELPAMAVADAVVRLIPGVLGDENSAAAESFGNGLLEYPQYTRPADFRGMKAPKILLSGNHQAIARWREKQAVVLTKRKRPDLLKEECHG